MLNILLSYLVFIPSSVLCFFPMRDQLRYSRRRTILSAGSIVVATTIIFSVLESRSPQLGENTFLIPLLLIFFATYHLHLKVHISKSLAVFCASVALISILTNFSICFDLFFRLSPRYDSRSSVTSLLQFGISTAVMLSLAHLHSKYGSRIINQTELPHIWYMTLPVSAAIYAVNMLLLPIEIGVERDLIVHLLFLLTVLLILWLLMQVALYIAVSSVMEMYRTRERNRLLELQKRQFSAQQRYMKESERVRHDFRQSIRALNELYEAADYTALGQYLRQYVETLPKNEITSFCGNTALNALLNYYVHFAARTQIDLKIQVRIPDELPVSDVDLCGMVGNILDNAVNACQKTAEQFIQLSIVAEDAVQLYIVAANSFAGTRKQKDGKTIFVNHGGPGIGLSSIVSTAESYGGVAQFSHDEKRFYSNVAIPLQ